MYVVLVGVTGGLGATVAHSVSVVLGVMSLVWGDVSLFGAGAVVLVVETEFIFKMSSSFGFLKQVVGLVMSGPDDQVPSVDLKVEDTNYGLHLEHLVCRRVPIHTTV